MRILLLVDCYLPAPKASAKLIHDLASEFRDQGHEPIVATPDDTLQVPVSISQEEGITVLRVRTGRIKGAARPLRALNEARLSSAFWRVGRNFFLSHPCDLVVFYSPTIFFGPLVKRLKREWGCGAYLILRDIFPQWAVDAGLLREGGLPWRFLRRRELLQYRVADRVGVQSPANLTYFREQGLEHLPLEVLYHWCPPRPAHLADPHLRHRLGLTSKVVFFYGGNIGVAQDMGNLVRLAESLRDRPEIHFLIVGDGSEAGRLRASIQTKSLDNMTLHGPVDQGRYLSMLSECDVGLLSLDRELRTQNFPGKALGYLQLSMPILASLNPGNDLQGLLEGYQAGLVSLTGDDRQLRSSAIRLAEDPELRQRLGDGGNRLLQEVLSTTRAVAQILHHFSPVRKRKAGIG